MHVFAHVTPGATEKEEMIFPIIRVRDINAAIWGRNARNNLFEVEIARYLDSNQSWLGVLAQEVYESHYKWRRGLIGVTLVKHWREDMELTSHTIEALVANQWDGHDYQQYLFVEAETLVSPWSSYRDKRLFKGMRAADVFGLMQQRAYRADKWVTANRRFLDRWAAKRREAS